MGYNAAILYDDVVLDVVKRDGNIEVTPDGDYSVSDDAINGLRRKFPVCIRESLGFKKSLWNTWVICHHFMVVNTKESNWYIGGYYIPNLLVLLCQCRDEFNERVINPVKLIAYLKKWFIGHIDVIERLENKWNDGGTTQNIDLISSEISELFYEELVRIWKNDKE